MGVWFGTPFYGYFKYGSDTYSILMDGTAGTTEVYTDVDKYIVLSNVTYSKGSTSYGNVAGTSSTAYPNNSYSGDYWYVYKGSDSIDPTAISYPTNIFKGQRVTVTITPGTPTYGGTISYKYEYTTNGSTWTTFADNVSSTSASVTLPSNATVFQARVTASDNMGYTSTTAVTGEQRTVYNIDPTAVIYNEDNLSIGNEMAIAITPHSSNYTGSVSYVVQTNVNAQGWETVTEVSSTNFTLTIPSDAISWAVRVAAKVGDYTSSTYVYGNGHETGVEVEQTAGFSILPENKHLGYLGSHELMQYYLSTDGNVSCTLVIALDGTTISSQIIQPGLQMLTLEEAKWESLDVSEEHTITLTATSGGKSIMREYRFYKFVYDPTTLPGLLDGCARAIKIKQGVSKQFWGYRLPMEILKIQGENDGVSAYIDVSVAYEAGMQITAVSSSGTVYSQLADSSGVTRINVMEKGDYMVSASFGSFTSGVVKVQISADDDVRSAALSFMKLNITTKAGATVTVSLNETVYTVIATSGTATVYLPNKGNWQVTATSGTQTQSKVVAVTAFTTYPVIIPLYSATFADNSWADIQAATQAGLASSYWNVGDAKEVTLNGSVGDSGYLSKKVKAFILGFDHNSLYEGTNTIHMCIGRNIGNGMDCALTDNYYGTMMTQCYNMNDNGSNGGGWASSNMRNNICSSFLYVLPTNLQAVIISCSKYTNNGFGPAVTPGDITATSDKIWIPSETETLGIRWPSLSDSDEYNYQQTYAYYINGNSEIRYQVDFGTQNEATSAVKWWLRSRAVNEGEVSFCCVSETGGWDSADASTSLGFVPCFVIG